MLYPNYLDLEVLARNLEKDFKNRRLEELEVKIAKKPNVTVADLKAVIEGGGVKACVT